jgi:pseudaminic acid synthase
MKKFINKIPFFIAEISGNHDGKISNAKKLIDLAKKGGADAVKLQTYTPEMMTLKKTAFKIKKGLWAKKNLWDLYEKAQTPLEWHEPLYSYARKKKIKIFSTPFSPDGVDFLEKLNTQIYKVSSFEMNDLNLIKKIASTKKPMIISTGLADLEEIEKTVNIAKKFGCKDLTLLYCVSNYPSDSIDFNLNSINILKKKFKCKVGLSDHSIGLIIPCLAVSKGAEVIEKHICLKNVNSVDSKFSLKDNEIKEFSTLLKSTYKITIGNGFLRGKQELKNKIFRRSIYATENIKKGEKFTDENIKTYRPNIGLSASFYFKILNKNSPMNIKKNKPLNKNIIKNLR